MGIQHAMMERAKTKIMLDCSSPFKKDSCGPSHVHGQLLLV
jgi:hypothetical protein